MCYKFGSRLMVLLGGGGSFKEAGPIGKKLGHCGHTLEGVLGSSAFLSPFLLSHQEVNRLPLSYAPPHDAVPHHGHKSKVAR